MRATSIGSLVRAALAALVVGAVGCSAANAPSRPNVVIAVLDTTRADVLSSYGNPVPTTPHLDRLTSEGVRFTRAYATDFWTLPSHASLFTGQYPSVHQATSETNRLPSRMETLAEVLRRAGYRTGAFVSNPWVSAERGFAQGFESFQEVWRPRPGLPLGDRGGLELARRFVRNRAARGEPFLLFVNLNTAHMPYAPDPETLEVLHPGPFDPDRRARLEKLVGLWRLVAGQEDLDEADFELLRALYEAEVATVDELFGELVEELRTQDLLDETLVVVTSDHGENLGEHGLIDHMLSMYETTVRIPLVLRYPARIGAGLVDDRLASLVDVGPTILDACGLPVDALGGPGRSLLDRDREPPAFVVAENERPVNGVELLKRAFPDFDTTEIDRPMRMLRTPTHKLVWRGGGRVELFDVERDPGEENDLAAGLPELTGELHALLDAWTAENRAEGPATRFESQDRESLDRLRALGYIE
jgi:arylsulfatase A-like enzyme